MVPYYERCEANIPWGNGESAQCSRRRLKRSKFCVQHSKMTPRFKNEFGAKHFAKKGKRTVFIFCGKERQMKNLSNYPPGVTGNEEQINPVDYEYKIVRDHGKYFVYNQFHSMLGNFSKRKEAQKRIKKIGGLM